MSRPSLRLTRFAFAVALVASMALGCGKKDEPQPNPITTPPVSGEPGSTPKLPPIQEGDPKPITPVGSPTGTEDPEVLAYFTEKGWKLHTDVRWTDNKQLMYLSVSHTVPGKGSLTADDYKMIAKSKTLQLLDLTSVNCTDDGLKVIAGIPQMEAIIVQGEEVTDAGIKYLGQSKSLDNITLIGTTKLDGSAFAAFAGSKTLTSITIDSLDSFTDEGAKYLAKLPKLNALKIGKGYGDIKLTAAGIKAITETRIPAKFEFDNALLDDDLLQWLVARGWFPVVLNYIEKPPTTPTEVRALSLEGSKVTDKGFAVLLNCTNTESLFLSRTALTDETLKKLTGFKKLNLLVLGETKVTAAGISPLAALPIKHIAMDSCELTEDVFKSLSKMDTIEQLEMNGAKLKPDWLKHISKLPNLQHISLIDTDFDDEAVKYISSLRNLRVLSLSNTKLSNAGFGDLLKLPNLKGLSVNGTKVTKEVYQKAKRDHPELSLSFSLYDD